MYMETGDNQKSIWTTKVIVPAVAIIVAGIATAVSDNLRTGIKNFFSPHQDGKPDTAKNIPAVKNDKVSVNDKVTVQLVLTNKNTALREDTVIFDDGETIYTDDAGRCFKQVNAGAHAFQVHAFNKTFHYSFFAPNKPDSLYTLAQDINYDLPPVSVAGISDTVKKAPVNYQISKAALLASKLPAAKMRIYSTKLTSKGQ